VHNPSKLERNDVVAPERTAQEKSFLANEDKFFGGSRQAGVAVADGN
jgi:hypothetical protein